MMDYLAALWKRDRALCSWLLLLGVIVLGVIVGPLFTQSSSAIDPTIRLQSSSTSHWLGTDEYGRDVLSRFVEAGRVSLGLGATVTIIVVVVGTVLGLCAGYYARADSPIMRVMDAFIAFPPLVLAIVVVAFLGGGFRSELIGLSIVFSPYLARVVRSSALALRERGYVSAARAAGMSGRGILWKHILPNTIPALLVQASFVFVFAILADASMSFLGLGVPAPTPTWGNMVGDARPYIMSQPWLIIFPGLAIILVVVTVSFIGDGVRDLVDPRTKSLRDLERQRSRNV